MMEVIEQTWIGDYEFERFMDYSNTRKPKVIFSYCDPHGRNFDIVFIKDNFVQLWEDDYMIPFSERTTFMKREDIDHENLHDLVENLQAFVERNYEWDTLFV